MEESFDGIIEILTDIFGNVNQHNENKGQISFDCPTCSFEIKGLDELDGKGNLEINYVKGVYKCWVCSETHDTHGSIFKLIRKNGNKKQIKNFNLLYPSIRNLPQNTYKKKIKLPDEYISFKDASFGLKLTPNFKQAYNYLKKRNITDDIINSYNIGFCTSGDYANRIIVPSYDEYGDLNYFVGRSYLSKTKFKYLNPEADKQEIIWNIDKIDWDKDIYIVEGVFDSFFVPNSIPLLGKVLSEKLFDIIYTNAKKDIIIILDGDAYNDAELLYHNLNCGNLIGRVWISKLPKEADIADLKGDLRKIEIKKLD